MLFYQRRYGVHRCWICYNSTFNWITLKKYISGSSYKGIILEILQLHISACCLPGAVYSYPWSSAFSLMQVKKLHKFSKSRHCIMNDCGRLNRPSNQVKCTHVFTCAGQKKEIFQCLYPLVDTEISLNGEQYHICNIWLEISARLWLVGVPSFYIPPRHLYEIDFLWVLFFPRLK